MAGNFQGRKLSRILRFFRHPRKFSPRNSRHATPILRPVLAFREMLLSYRSAKIFSLENFPLYGNARIVDVINNNYYRIPPELSTRVHQTPLSLVDWGV